MRGRRALPPLLLLLALQLPGCGAWKRCAYEGWDRDDWQEPERVVAELGLEPGDHVADLGAGGGYFTFRLAEAVGPAGRVYAVDVDPDMIAHLEERVASEGWDNVEVVQGGYEDPRLPDGEIDLLFTCNTYHHIEDRSAYFARIRERDLDAGGRVAVVEFDDRSWFPRTVGHHTPKREIVEEMRAAGFALRESPDFLERQSFTIFEAAAR